MSRNAASKIGKSLDKFSWKNSSYYKSSIADIVAINRIIE